MVLFLWTTISGLRVVNMALSCSNPGISTKSFAPSTNAVLSQLARMYNTASCLRFYRSRATGEEQLLKTCLLVCTWLHSGHRLQVDLPHWTRLDMVGSCWMSAFRTKQKITNAVELMTRLHELIIFLSI